MNQKQKGQTLNSTPATSQLPLQKPFNVVRPMLWLALAAFIVYLPTLNLGFTDLDDGIFINDQYAFNSKLSNIFTTFRESVMVDAVGDIYYRPIYNISLILSTLTSGQDIGGWHAMNILLHIIAVLLLYKLLIALHVSNFHSFLLSLVFAVHPALVMAISWMPGRTDIILAIFAFAFLLQSINSSETGKAKALTFSALWLLCALFSKESAVFLLPTAFVIHVFLRRQKWNDKRYLLQYGIWIMCFVIWFVFRNMSDAAAMNVPPEVMIKSIFQRIPVLGQYIGKTILPFDLSTYPNVHDTSGYLGIAALLLLGAAIYFNKNRDLRTVIGGALIFVVLMAPLLLIPDYINKQTFEYRLYLPILGLLIILPETVLLRNKLTPKQLLLSTIGICTLFIFLNVKHQENFGSPYAFWSNAVKTSPHDSYANMMLSARETDTAESRKLFERAFELNPRERFVNYIYASNLQEKGRIAESEKYLLIEKEVTGYSKCDLLLARVARQREDYKNAIRYMESYLKSNPTDASAQLNMLILYMENDQYADALKQEKYMDNRQMEIPSIIRAQIKR